MSYPFSRASQYAISALIYLARQGTGAVARQSDVAVAIEAPLPYLSKLLAVLSRARLIHARRGPNGGVRLAMPPDSIRLGEIVATIEGAPVARGCILGNPHCDEREPCALHKNWVDIRTRIAQDLEQRTLADLVGASTATVEPMAAGVA